MTKVTLEEARERLPELVAEIAATVGAVVLLMDHGRPVAALIGPSELVYMLDGALRGRHGPHTTN